MLTRIILIWDWLQFDWPGKSWRRRLRNSRHAWRLRTHSLSIGINERDHVAFNFYVQAAPLERVPYRADQLAEACNLLRVALCLLFQRI